MARETSEIRRDIAATRQEIDEHLQELSGEVRGELNIGRQARQNMPQLLAGAAILGLSAGVLFGHGGRSRESRGLAREQTRLAREWKRLAQERGRMHGGYGLSEYEERPIALDLP